MPPPRRPDIAIHRIDGFKGDQFRRLQRRSPQQFLEMRDIIVPPDMLLAFRPFDAFNHGGVIQRV